MPMLSTFHGGWVLRPSRHLYKPQELIDCTNLVNDELGALTTRKGHTLVNSVTGDLTSYFVLYTVAGVAHTYQGAFTGGNTVLTRNFVTTLLTNAGSLVLDFADLEEFGGGVMWAYIANILGADGYQTKDNGTTSRRWGIQTPSFPVIAGGGSVTAGAGGSLTTGFTYVYAYRYVRQTSSTVVAMGNSTFAVQGLSTTLGGGNTKITITGVHNPADPADTDYDPQVTHIEVYRTLAFDTLSEFADSTTKFFYEQSIAAVGAGTLTITSTIADTDLGDVLDPDDNNTPPRFISIAHFRNRIFGVVANSDVLHFSKAFYPESFPSAYTLTVGTGGEPVTAVRSFNDNLYIFSASKVYRLDGYEPDTFITREMNAPTGTVAPLSVAAGLKALYFLGNDGLYGINGNTVINLTVEKLDPLFRGATVHGFAPLDTTSAIAQSAGGFFERRYYLSYVVSGGSVPTKTLMYDEPTDTWYPDSRGFRRFFANERAHQCIVTDTTGHAFTLETGTTDNAVAIDVVFQSADLDDGAPMADKQLAEVVIEANTGSATATVTLIKDYSDTPTAFTTMTTAARTERHLAATYESHRAKAFGYRLTMTGVLTLYRIIPHVQVLPPDLYAFDVERTDFGYDGAKWIQSLWMDLELLSAGTVTGTFYNEAAAAVGTFTVTTTGRSYTEVLSQTQPFEALTFGLQLRADVLFRVWPGTQAEWLPLPPWRRALTIYPTQLGYDGVKRFESLVLDTELQSAGTLTVTPIADGVGQTAISITTVTRLAANWLGATFDARLFSLTFASAVNFRLWGATPSWLALPPDGRAFSIPPGDLGYPGKKLIQAFILDFEILDSAAITITITVDGVAQTPITTTATNGRYKQSLLTASLTGTLIGITFASAGGGGPTTGHFRLWPGSAWEYSALPEDTYTFATLPNDFGYPGTKRAEELVVDVETTGNGQTINGTILGDGVSQQTFTITTATAGRTQRSVLTTSFDARLLEVRMTSTSVFRVWNGTAFGWLPLPHDVYVWSLPATDLGYHGKKLIESLTLDFEILDSIAITATVTIDGVAQTPIVTTATNGRYEVSLLPASLTATLVSLVLTSTGRFRLWGGSHWQSLPLPEDTLSFAIVPSDLGYPGYKRFEELAIDLETTVDGQTVNGTMLGDGSSQQTFAITTATKGRSQRNVLTTSFDARLAELRLTSTGIFRVWPGTVFGWLPLPHDLYVFSLPATDLGYPGVKLIEGLILDFEILDSVAITITLTIDGVAQTPFATTATNGRYQQNFLTASVQGKLVRILMTSTGRFRLWGGSHFQAIPFPEDSLFFAIVPTDLGYQGFKRFDELAIDVETTVNGQTVNGTVYGDSVSQQTFVITTATAGRSHTNVLTTSFDARLVEVRLSSTSVFRVWSGTVFGWLPLPHELRTLSLPPVDMGVNGAKSVQSLELDYEILDSLALILLVYGDTTLVQTITTTAVNGRYHQSLLTSAFEAKLLRLAWSSAGRFRLWGGTLAYVVLPDDTYVVQIPPTDLGAPGLKVAQFLTLDLDVLEAGPVTASLQIDGTTYTVATISTLGRQKTQRYRAPRAAHGRLVGVTVSSAGRFRPYEGSSLGWSAVGGVGEVQRLPLIQMGRMQGIQRRGLGELGLQATGGLRDPQQTPLLGPGVGALQKLALQDQATGASQQTALVAPGLGAPQQLPLLSQGIGQAQQTPLVNSELGRLQRSGLVTQGGATPQQTALIQAPSTAQRTGLANAQTQTPAAA